MKSVQEMLAEVEVLFAVRVRNEQERRALAAMAIPERRQRLRDLWKTEAPNTAPHPGPTCAESLELAVIEAEIEREMADLDDPPYVSPAAEATWDASYPPGKTTKHLHPKRTP